MNRLFRFLRIRHILFPARIIAPALVLTALLSVDCDTDLAIEPEESQYSEAGLLLSTYVVSFAPTFIGQTSTQTIGLEYGDTVQARVHMVLSDNSVFRVKIGRASCRERV